MVGTSFFPAPGCQAALIHFQHGRVANTGIWLFGKQAAGAAQPDASYLKVFGGVLRLRSEPLVTYQVGTPDLQLLGRFNLDARTALQLWLSSQGARTLA